MTEFQKQINNKEKTKADFPIGSKIYIDYIADSTYHPEAVGKHAIVAYVDDASHVACEVQKTGQYVTLCKEYGDRFFKV